MGFALSLGLVAAMARPRQRVLLVCLAALAAFCNLYTYSAGGILATVVSTVVLVLFFRSGRLLVVALAALVVIALLAPPALLAKVERLLTGEALTAAARLVTYQQALEIIRDHPVFGLGWGAMSTSLEGAYRITRADAVAFTVENYFLQRAVALGLVGLGLFVGLWVRFIVNLRRLMRSSGGPRRPDPLAIAMAASAIAFFTHAMFMPASNVSTNSVLWFLFAVAGSLSDGSGTAGHLT
jgi:O-antigen ligase